MIPTPTCLFLGLGCVAFLRSFVDCFTWLLALHCGCCSFPWIVQFGEFPPWLPFCLARRFPCFPFCFPCLPNLCYFPLIITDRLSTVPISPSLLAISLLGCWNTSMFWFFFFLLLCINIFLPQYLWPIRSSHPTKNKFPHIENVLCFVWCYIKVAIYKLFNIFRKTICAPPSVLIHHLLLCPHSGLKLWELYVWKMCYTAHFWYTIFRC